MMRRLFLWAALLLAGPALSDAVLPRLGPLPVLAEDGSVNGVAAIPFGTRLTLLSKDGAVLTVQADGGQPLRVRATDVIAAPKVGLTLMPSDQGAGAATGRPDLQLWDSALQLRVFLGGAGSGQRLASMRIPGESDLAMARLPVLSIDTAETTVGTPVTMVQALFPLMLKALDPAGQGQGQKLVLHVLVDGSDYARPFLLETLRLLSRTLAEQPTVLAEDVHFTRQVLFDSGTLRDDGAVSASGLRSEWPASEVSKKKASMTQTLSAALQDVADGIDPSDPATHLVLILTGPGLSDDPMALKSARAAGARLAKAGRIGGIVMAQGTPEPNPANAAVLAALAGDAPTGLADFGADLLSDLTALSKAKTQDPNDNLVTAICADAALASIPCLIPTGSTVPPETSSSMAVQDQTIWVALPLWVVSESAPLDLVPDGSVAADVHEVQPELRACGAIGLVWDTANNACGPNAEIQGLELSNQLNAAQAEINATLQDRDAAREALAAIEDTIASQTAALSEAQAIAAAQADQLTRLAAEDRTVKEALLAAQNRAADLSASLGQRNADLLVATEQITTLGQQEDQIIAALNAAETKLAALEVTAAALSQSLDDEAALKAASAAKAVQTEADWQARLTSIEADAAERDHTIAALSQSLDAERDAKADSEASAAQAQTDLQDRLTAGAASSAALQAQIAQAQTTVSALQSARDDVSARLATAEAALAAAEQALLEKDAQIAELDRQIGNLVTSMQDRAQKLADLDAALAQERQTSETLQAAVAEQSRLEGEIADLIKTDDLNATLLTQFDAAKVNLAALQTQNDALARANAAAASQLMALSGAADEADARLAAVTQDLAATRATVEKVQADNQELSTANATAISQLTVLSGASESSDAMLAQVSQDLAAARLRLETVQTEHAGQIATLHSQVADLTTTRGDLSDQVAQLTAEKTSLAAALQAERDALAVQVSGAEQQVPALPRVAQAPVVAADLATAPEPPLFADAAAPRPKLRPTGLAETGGQLVARTPTATAPPKVTSRQVAPSLKAPRLNGCKFQWTGQAGKLICP